MFDFRRWTVFCLGRRFSKHKRLDMLKILGLGPLVPPGYAYTYDLL